MDVETEKKPILEAKGLHQVYTHPVNVPILKGIDLTIAEGESVAITGPSGEGKSTLLQILGTLDPPTEGSLQIAGYDVLRFQNKTKVRNRHLAFIFQSFHLLEDYSALENVLMPARIGRKSVTKNSPAYLRGCQLLEKVGLGDRLHFRTKQLSGGEKQRVAIARALCNDPDLILADEPSGNLDGENSALVHQLLLDFANEGGKALVVVTHDPTLANMCSRRYTLSNGKLHLS